MKYKFITALHFMKLESRYNKGIQLYPGIRITNGPEVRNEILGTKLMKSTLGTHSIDELENTVYYYKSGDFPSTQNKEELQGLGLRLTFYFLREAQSFVRDLWGVKDNGIYVRDGFLIAYDDDIEKGVSFKASLSEVFTDASVSRDVIEFTKSEVESAIQNFEQFSMDEISKYHDGMKHPNFDHFYKKNKPERLHKAEYFTVAARANSAVPMKIVLYCTALECLFSTATTEVSHRIGERVAVLLGTSSEEKKDLFKFIKKAYDYRSTIVHGSNIKVEEGALSSVSVRLNDILRQILHHGHDIFNSSNLEIDEFFTELIFN